MYQEIYIDIVFVTNLLMDYILLRFVGILFRFKGRRWQCFGAAAGGSLISCLLLLIETDRNLGMTIFLHGACALGMVRVGWGIKKGSLLIKTMILLYMTAFLCGGFWDVISRNRELSIKTFLLCAVCTYFGSSAFVCLSDSIRTRTQNIYPITLTYKGKVQSAYGFYDTGNMLTDSLSGAAVSIIQPEVLNKILSEDLIEKLKYQKENYEEMKSTELVDLKPHFLTYQSIGSEQGLLLAVTLETLCIHTPGEVVHVSKPVFAFSFEPSTLGKEYEVLLNSRLFH